jgi:N-acyl-D-amino-acid deacylase
MIRKMTSLPAYVYNFKNKGMIKEGCDADICIFDYEKLTDRAEYTNPFLHAEGLNYVIIGGVIVAEDAVYTGELPAAMLLYKKS